MEYIAELNIDSTKVSLRFTPPYDIFRESGITEDDTDEIFDILLDEFEEAYSWDDVSEFNAFIERWSINKEQLYYLASTGNQNPDDTWGPVLRSDTGRTYIIGRDDLQDILVRITKP